MAIAEHLLVVIHLGAAPGAATVLPEHPHIESRVAVILEVEGAPPAQATRAGKRLLAPGQDHIPGDGDLHRDPGGPAAAAVRLQP